MESEHILFHVTAIWKRWLNESILILFFSFAKTIRIQNRFFITVFLSKRFFADISNQTRNDLYQVDLNRMKLLRLRSD